MERKEAGEKILGPQEEKEQEEKEALSPEQQEMLKMKNALNKEKFLVNHLVYLSVLQRLGENRHLENLFDGEIIRGPEEAFAIFALIDIANGNDRFAGIKPPKEIEVDLNRMRWDVQMDINYVSESEGESVDKENGEFVLDSLDFNTTGYFNESKLTFVRGEDGMIDHFLFDRPRMGWDQKILLERDEDGKVIYIRADQDWELDNKLKIDYDNNGNPIALYQTKLGLANDKTFFFYDDGGNLNNIIYLPVLSLKQMKGGLKKLSKANTVKQMWRVVEKLILKNIKMLKGMDVIHIELKDGVPVATETNLDSSNWFYTEGSSKMTFDKEGKLTEQVVEQEEIFRDSKATYKVVY